MKILVNSERRDFIEVGDKIRLELWHYGCYVQKILPCTSCICPVAVQESSKCNKENKGVIFFKGYPNLTYCLSHNWIQCSKEEQ